MMARVLVTDGEQRSALAVARSLGRAGHTVYVCSARSRCLAGVSRHARAQVAVPDPLRRPDAFARAVRHHVERWEIDVVLPLTEPAILAVLAVRDGLGARVPPPDLDRFRRVCDKAAVLDAAAALGIAVPAQRRLDSPAQRPGPRTDGLSFPLVVKPVRSVADGAGGRVKTAVRHVGDPDALDATVAAFPASVYPLLLQERIPGHGVGVFLLLRRDRTIAAFSHRRIREKPPSGGVSVYRESIPLDPTLLERSRALLRAFDWEGVAMVEYRVDARTGTAYLMEINGRLWGSLQLAIDAGVDFPALLVEAVMGGEPRPVVSYRVGERSRWWWGDVDHFLARLRGARATVPSGADGRSGRGRALLDLLGSLTDGGRPEVFRLGDPVPAIRESVDWVRGR